MAEQVLIQFRADKELKQEVAEINEVLLIDIKIAEEKRWNHTITIN